MKVLSGLGGPLCKSLRIILGRVWEGRAGIEKHYGFRTFGNKKTAFSSDVSAMFRLGELGYCLCQARGFWIRKPGSILDFPRRILDGEYTLTEEVEKLLMVTCLLRTNMPKGFVLYSEDHGGAQCAALGYRWAP